MWEEFSELVTNEDGVEYTAYGIRQGDCRIADITVNQCDIRTLLARFNDFVASELHALALVEDFLVEMYS
ncbi:MAG: hypothetical protein IJZ47_13170 [Oscillospiraceae bacterium]|nr:hypothetical protein [Oscillospiraceae bacterium]